VFDLVNGLPVHPLAVHAVTVLVPLAVLGTIAIALRPSWRERYGVLVLAITFVAMVSVPIATSSGEALAKRVGQPDFNHAALADQLKWFVIPMFVLVAAYVIGSRRRLAGNGRRVVATLAVLAALATAWQTYRVGDSGAKSVWQDQVSAPVAR
jgi:uncharacterized membrane protein